MPSWLNFTGNTLTLESDLHSDAPAFEKITLTVTLADYPDAVASFDFTVELKSLSIFEEAKSLLPSQFFHHLVI